MISRGQHWVDEKVPYDENGKTYEGYRMDCSGFVSMCWELGTSKSTKTLGEVAHNINKDDLQPGDAIICEGRHDVLFVGWTSSDRSHYVSMC